MFGKYTRTLIAQTLTMGLVLCGPAYAGDGKFTLLPKGGKAPFEATCFDDEATAKLLTWKEFLEQEQQKLCDFEKEKLTLDYDLVIKNIQITLDETQARCQVEIDTRDRELEELRDIIKKNKKLSIPVVVATSVAVGFGIGFGTYHLASK
jgi:glutaredoxin